MILLFAFVGGITTVSGAVLAGALFALLVYAQATFPTSPAWCSSPSAPRPSASAASPTGSPALAFAAVDRRRAGGTS